MPFPLLLALGAAAGLGKSFAFDAPRERRQRKLAAETQRVSPWTGLQANPVQEADPLGSALSFGLTGYQLDQGSRIADLNEKLGAKYDKLLEKAINSPNGPTTNLTAGVGAGGGNPWGSFPNPAMTAQGPVGVPAFNPYGQIGGGWAHY